MENEGPSGWNPGDRDRILLAGRAVDIPTIRFVLATLSAKSRGQIFIEVDTADEIDTLVAPSRFAICWLIRDRGQDLQRSVDAWLSEMLPVSGTEEHSVFAWFASDGVPRVLSSN